MGEAKRVAEVEVLNINAECCGTCRFGSAENVQAGQVLCRRYPPAMIVSHVMSAPVAQRPTLQAPQGGVAGIMAETQGVTGHFPVMSARDGWCGEYATQPGSMN